MELLTNPIVVIILKYIRIPNHCIVHLTQYYIIYLYMLYINIYYNIVHLTQYYMSHTSVRLGKK